MTETVDHATLALFDYGALDTETREFVAERTTALRTRLQRAAEDIVNIGTDLLAVKERLPYGQFLDWLDAEFDMSERSAYNLMSVADKFATAASLERVAPTALYLLAASSTPAEARAEALELAEAGEKITRQIARAIVDEHRPEEEKITRQIVYTSVDEHRPEQPNGIDRTHDLPEYTEDEVTEVLPKQMLTVLFAGRDDQTATEPPDEEMPEPLPYAEAKAVVKRIEQAIAALTAIDPGAVSTIAQPALLARVNAAGRPLVAWTQAVVRGLGRAS